MKKILCLVFCAIFVSAFVLASVDVEVTGNLNKDKTDKEIAMNKEVANSLNRMQERIRSINDSLSGDYALSNGKKLQVIERRENALRMRIGESETESSLEIYLENEVEGNTFKFRVNMSNGVQKEVKIMPETASERAIERLRLKNCNESNGCRIELKEVGNKERARVAYEVRAEKEAKVLGLFKKKMKVQVEIDAETGEVIKSKKPWWAFLASE